MTRLNSLRSAFINQTLREGGDVLILRDLEAPATDTEAETSEARTQAFEGVGARLRY